MDDDRRREASLMTSAMSGSAIVGMYVIGRYFCSYFRPFSTQFHSTFLTPPFPLCFTRSQTNDKNAIQLVQPDTEQLVYWATDIPKQSCCGSSSPGSCAGTSSAATERSHHSKFRTSRTWSMSRSASTARRPRVIAKFLATTTARLL